MAPTFGQRLVWFWQALLLAVFWQVCALMSLDRASAFGGAVMQRLGPYYNRKHRRFWRNLRVAFPDRSNTEIDAITRETWDNCGRSLAEYPHLATLARNRGAGRIAFVARDEEAAWRRLGKPAVFVSAHLANWELAGSRAITGDIPLVGVYSPDKNPLIDRMVQRRRRALGCELISKNASVRDLMRHLEAGRSIGLLADQRVDGGEVLPFFGHPASTTTAPARLALRLGLELVPIRIERLDGARFRVTAFGAVVPSDRSKTVHEQASDMARQVNALFESWIRERPGQWLCAKRRWPRSLRPMRAAKRRRRDSRKARKR